jgi:hypothetical protein
LWVSLAILFQFLFLSDLYLFFSYKYAKTINGVSGKAGEEEEVEDEQVNEREGGGVSQPPRVVKVRKRAQTSHLT